MEEVTPLLEKIIFLLEQEENVARDKKDHCVPSLLIMKEAFITVLKDSCKIK